MLNDVFYNTKVVDILPEIYYLDLNDKQKKSGQSQKPPYLGALKKKINGVVDKKVELDEEEQFESSGNPMKDTIRLFQQKIQKNPDLMLNKRTMSKAFNETLRVR